jgi:hypothetical protein
LSLTSADNRQDSGSVDKQPGLRLPVAATQDCGKPTSTGRKTC